MTLLSPYATILRHPGALRFSLAALIARMPLSMMGLGIVLIVSAREGGYAVAGVITAAYVVAAAAAIPIGARYVDRWGQRRVVSLLVAVHVAGLVGFVLSVSMGAAVPVLAALAVIAGGTQPAIGSLVRARWVAVFDAGDQRLRTAFAWESVLDEVVFIVGPPLATILALWWAPGAPLLVAALLVLTGSLLLVAQRGTEPAVVEDTGDRTGAWRNPGIIWLTLVMLALGSVFGSVEIVTVAAAADLGVPAAAGGILALYALGSLVGGIAFGSRPPARLAPATQLLVGTAVLAAVTLPFPFVRSLLPLALAALLAGIAVAPVLILANGLVQSVVAEGQLTEGLAWINSTGLGAGVALSAAVSGTLVDRHGFSAGYALTAASGLATVVIAIVAHRSLAASGSGEAGTWRS